MIILLVSKVAKYMIIVMKFHLIDRMALEKGL